ncbi:MAG: hypothetical protein ACYSWU_18810 [Planctomycetota bacterium]|jgi:hypothetical protein
MQYAPDRTEGTLPIIKSFAVVEVRQNPRRRDYLARREQWRLLLLVMSLGLVVLLMSEARDAKNWAWLFGSGEGGNGSPSTLVRTDDAPAGHRLPQRAPREDTPGGFFPGVEPAYLDQVRDDTIDRDQEQEAGVFRDQEQDAWFHLFEILNTTDEARLRQRSIGPIAYGQLFRQSQQYRGRLATVRGTIRRTSLPRVADNDYHIDRYYQTVLQPADSPSELMFVYCLHLPEGFPQGLKVSADVEVTGFYFKRWAYPAQDKVRIAPVLLARTVRWSKRPPAVGQRPVGVGAVLTWTAVALGATLLVVVYVYRRTRRTQPQEPAARPEFDALRDVPTASGARLPWETVDRGEP